MLEIKARTLSVLEIQVMYSDLSTEMHRLHKVLYASISQSVK